MDIVTKKELIKIIWGICKFDAEILARNEQLLKDGVVIRRTEDHEVVAKIGHLMSYIYKEISKDNTIRELNISEYICVNEVPEQLKKTELEVALFKIQELLSKVSNP